MKTPKGAAGRGDDGGAGSEAWASPPADPVSGVVAGVPAGTAATGDTGGTATPPLSPHAAGKVAPHLAALKAMLDATPDGIQVVSVDGTVLAMNRAGRQALRVADESGLATPWLRLFPQEVQALGADALRRAAAGRSGRFLSKSVSPQGAIVYWDNLLSPVADAAGEVLAVLCISRDVTRKAVLEQRLEEAVDRERLRSLDLHHRVRNLFSLVSGLISLAEKESAAARAPEAATSILRRNLRALSGAVDIAFTRGQSEEGGEAAVNLEPVVRAVLQPYGNRCTVLGQPTSIRREAVTTYAIFLNELATNAVKYGALSTDKGHVTLRWAENERMLHLTWIETEGPEILSAPERRGFGTELVDRLVWSAGGTINRTWRTEGLVVDLHLPNAGPG